MPKTEKVMLAKTYIPGKTPLAFPVIVQPKLDGVRAIWDGEQFTSRNEKVFVLPQLASLLKQVIPPTDQVSIDGELLIPGAPRNQTSGVCRAKEHRRKEEMAYILFDRLDEGPFVLRWNKLQSIASKRNLKTYYEHSKMYSLGSKLMMCPWTIVQSYDELMELYAKYLRMSFEGIMIRNPGAEYHFYRSSALLKFKPVRSLVAKIVGFVEGTGRLEGTLGALEVVFKETFFHVGSGLTDDLRDTIWGDKHSFLGASIKVEFQDFSEYGVPDFPRFKKLII